MLKSQAGATFHLRKCNRNPAGRCRLPGRFEQGDRGPRLSQILKLYLPSGAFIQCAREIRGNASKP